jgi:hypothetical protein
MMAKPNVKIIHDGVVPQIRVEMTTGAVRPRPHDGVINPLYASWTLIATRQWIVYRGQSPDTRPSRVINGLMAT